VITISAMSVVQCCTELDRQFKGDVSEPGSDRSKLFFQRTSTLHDADISPEANYC